MLTEIAKEVITTMALVELTGPKDLLVAAFVETCCPGDTKSQRHEFAINELNTTFVTRYRRSVITEWINGVFKGKHRSMCPEKFHDHMRWRLLLSITPDDNDEAMLALIRLLGIPHEAAELHIRNNM